MDIVERLTCALKMDGCYWQGLGNDALVEITTLRQQVAIRDLELLKLREALSEISIADPNGWCVINHNPIQARHVAKQALSTPLTTDHLNELLKEKIGEQIGTYSTRTGKTTMFNHRKLQNDYGIVLLDLYSVKEIV
jgi:hypothetical protein